MTRPNLTFIQVAANGCFEGKLLILPICFRYSSKCGVRLPPNQFSNTPIYRYLFLASLFQWSNNAASYAQKLVTVRLGGVLKLLDPVLELNPLNDFWQSICAAELPPFLLG